MFSSDFGQFITISQLNFVILSEAKNLIIIAKRGFFASLRKTLSSK